MGDTLTRPLPRDSSERALVLAGLEYILGLRLRGVTVRLKPDGGIGAAPREALTDEMRDLLRGNRDAILAALRHDAGIGDGKDACRPLSTDDDAAPRARPGSPAPHRPAGDAGTPDTPDGPRETAGEPQTQHAPPGLPPAPVPVLVPVCRVPTRAAYPCTLHHAVPCAAPDRAAVAEYMGRHGLDGEAMPWDWMFVKVLPDQPVALFDDRTDGDPARAFCDAANRAVAVGDQEAPETGEGDIERIRKQGLCYCVYFAHEWPALDALEAGARIEHQAARVVLIRGWRDPWWRSQRELRDLIDRSGLAAMRDAIWRVIRHWERHGIVVRADGDDGIVYRRFATPEERAGFAARMTDRLPRAGGAA